VVGTVTVDGCGGRKAELLVLRKRSQQKEEDKPTS